MEECAQGEQPAHRVEILVVDDHREIAELVAEMLCDEGYSVRTAHDGASALLAIRQRCPDLLILDVAMPVLTGDQVLLRLRSEGLRTLPVILMTADRSPERFSALGADEIVPKPFDIACMMRTVAGFVQPRREGVGGAAGRA